MIEIHLGLHFQEKDKRTKNKTKRRGFPGRYTIYDISVYYLAKKDSLWTISIESVEGTGVFYKHVYNFVYFYRLRFSDQLDCNEGQSSKNLPEQQQITFYRF